MLSAQSNTGASSHRCGTDVLHARLSASNPELVRREALLERQYRRYLDQRPGSPSRSTYTIPVVVHVIQYSCLNKISDARIQSQIEVLNEDFRLLNADTSGIPAEFKPFAADTEIEFCLASTDPNGCPTDGIVRVVAPDLADHAIGQSGQMKALSQWDPQKYLNIWVPVSIADNILGYATFPGTLQSNPAQDGVVINGHYMGRGNGINPGSFDLGRTGTHEVGHYLGLFHTFQGGCSGDSLSNCSSEGDRVCDTPPTSSPNYGCPPTRNSCMESPVDHNDMMVNYMDYGDDACLLMFSAGQKDRMGFFLNNTRTTLWSAPNLSDTGCDGTTAPGCYPVANFSASSITICEGDTVYFTSLATGPATSWSWSLVGGMPASSSLENPSATFSQAGIYSVSLGVSNAFGFDLKTLDIEVLQADLPPMAEGFEGATLPGGWEVRDEDKAGSWQQTDVAASEGQYCMVNRNYIQREKGSRDELLSPLYDLSTATQAALIFDYAYKKRDAFSPDSLNILVTTDCGRTWEKIWSRGGNSLPTVPGLSIPAEFVPNSSQWKSDTIDLADYLGATGLRFVFQCIGGYGQSLYLDRINLDALVTGQDEAEDLSARLEISPNPFREQPEIALELQKADEITWQLHDLQGRVVQRKIAKFSASGRHLLDFEPGFWGNLPAGVYIMVVSGSNGGVSKKLVKL